MKKIKKLFYLLIALTLVISCEKESVQEIDNYNETPYYKNIENLKGVKTNYQSKDNSEKLVSSCEIVNGSFETGDFTGWNVELDSEPFLDWLVVGSGFGVGFGMETASPRDGNYVAINGFDGAGPMTFSMYQDIKICRCAQLSWSHRIQWDYTLGSIATKPRKLFVQIRNPETNQVLETLYQFSTKKQSVNPTGDTGWMSFNFDLSKYVNKTIRIFFLEKIPQDYSGPAQIEFDNISVGTDSDGDNFLDECDNHPYSNTDPMLMLDCYLDIENQMIRKGTFMNDEIQDAINMAEAMEDVSDSKRTRKFRSKMYIVVNYWWYKYKLINSREKREILECVNSMSYPFNQAEH